MRTSDIIKEIQRLPINKRIYVIEKSMRLIRIQENESKLRKAADLLISDYETDSDLTAFTNLDFEDFYETK